MPSIQRAYVTAVLIALFLCGTARADQKAQSVIRSLPSSSDADFDDIINQPMGKTFEKASKSTGNKGLQKEYSMAFRYLEWAAAKDSATRDALGKLLQNETAVLDMFRGCTSDGDFKWEAIASSSISRLSDGRSFIVLTCAAGADTWFPLPGELCVWTKYIGSGVCGTIGRYRVEGKSLTRTSMKVQFDCTLSAPEGSMDDETIFEHAYKEYTPGLEASPQ
jgi:hypothetical protein